jgi:hypothetical protein
VLRELLVGRGHAEVATPQAGDRLKVR